MKKNAIIGQSGGPSPVINASLYGLITALYAQPDVDKVYGMRYGIEGVKKDNLVDLEFLRPGTHGGDEKLRILKHTPSAFLGSCRYKMVHYDEDESEYVEIFNRFEQYNIGYFFYIGGNDSMDTANKLCSYAKAKGIDMVFIGVPKTIDNDLVYMDHVPGYGSSAKYIATTVSEMLYDSHVYDRNTIIVTETMGRHAGWLTAAGALAVEQDNHDELMLYLPESPFDMDEFCDDVAYRVNRLKRIIVVASEGLKVSDGRFVSELDAAAERDAFGHAALGGCSRVLVHALRKKMKAKLRPVELSVMQRCAGHILSLTDINESALAGATAVEYAFSGLNGKLVSLVRKPGPYYIVETQPVDIGEICNKERLFPKEWITDDRFVTEDFYRYAMPLIQNSPELVTKNGGLPLYIHL